jgi:hypothetical protein
MAVLPIMVLAALVLLLAVVLPSMLLIILQLLNVPGVLLPSKQATNASKLVMLLAGLLCTLLHGAAAA